MENKCSRKEDEIQTCQNLIENAQEKEEKQKEKDVSKCGKNKTDNQYMLDCQKEFENEEKENKNEGSNKKEYANIMVYEQQMENCVTSVGEGEHTEKCNSKNSREQGQNKTIENDSYEHTKEMHTQKGIQTNMETFQTKSTNEDENEQNKIDSASGFSQNEENKYMIGHNLDVIAQEEPEKQILGGILSKCAERVEEQSNIGKLLSECSIEAEENPRLRGSLDNVFHEEGIYTTFEKELNLKCSIEMKEEETKNMRGNVRDAKGKRNRRKLAKQALKNRTVNIPKEKSIMKKPAKELPKDKTIDTKLWYGSRKLKLQLRYKYGTFSDCLFSELPLTRQNYNKEDKYYCSLGLLSSLKHDHKYVYTVFNVQAEPREFRGRLPFHPKGGGVHDYVFYDIPGFEDIPEDLPIIAEVNVYTPPPPPPDHLDIDSMNPGNQQQQINLNISESIVLPLFANSENESDNADMHTQSPQHSNPSTPPPDFLE